VPFSFQATTLNFDGHQVAVAVEAGPGDDLRVVIDRGEVAGVASTKWPGRHASFSQRKFCPDCRSPACCEPELLR
jgi:hypothetical protein